MKGYSYSQKQIVELTGVNKNSLQLWVRDGLVIPSLANPEGRGKTRLYSEADITMVALIDDITRLGYKRDIVENMCAYLNDPKNREIRNFFLSWDIKEDDIVILKLYDGHWKFVSNIKGKGTDRKIFESDILGNNDIMLYINISKIVRKFRR